MAWSVRRALRAPGVHMKRIEWIHDAMRPPSFCVQSAHKVYIFSQSLGHLKPDWLLLPKKYNIYFRLDCNFLNRFDCRSHTFRCCLLSSEKICFNEYAIRIQLTVNSVMGGCCVFFSPHFMIALHNLIELLCKTVATDSVQYTILCVRVCGITEHGFYM